MSNPAFLAKEIAAQEAAKSPAGEQAKNNAMLIGQSALPAAADLQVNQAQNANLAAQNQAAASASPSILDLPDEVKKNIVGYEDLELDEMLIQSMARYNAAINADRIIMTLYSLYKKNPTRVKVLARLRYLTEAGVIKKVEGARSMYARVIG